MGGKLRVCWLSPCLGVGGGDGFMLHMIRQSKHLETVGIVLEGRHQPKRFGVSPAQFERALHCLGGLNVPVFQIHSSKVKPIDNDPRGPVENEPVVEHRNMWYTDTFMEAAQHAAANADVVISWCFPHLKEIRDAFHGLPIIELTQNEDSVASNIAAANAPFADAWVGVSGAALACFPEPYQSQGSVIPNGVDLNRCTPGIGGKKLRQQIGIPQDAKVVVFHGRVCKEKNPFSVVQAVKELPDPWCGLVVGDGDSLKYLKEEAGRHCPSRIGFVEPWVHPGDILSIADVFMLASDFEGLPLAMIEAMVAGVPVVASKFTAMKEMTQAYGEIATLVSQNPRASSQELANACLEAVSKEAFRRTMLAQVVAMKHFSISRVTAQWEELIFNVVHNHRMGKLYPKVESPSDIGPMHIAGEVVPG